nr:MAG TPA: hypothetical protein [Inoviridae sp.]
MPEIYLQYHYLQLESVNLFGLSAVVFFLVHSLK